MGNPIGTGAILGTGAIEGKINWLGSSVSISDATFELDGNAAEGALSATLGEGLTGISGTLAFESFDLSPYIEAARAWLVSAGSWQLAPARLPLDAIGDIDLRLSTSRLIAGNSEIGRTGATVTLQNGELVVNVGEAELGEGSADARLALAMDKEDLTATAQLRLQDVAVAEILGEYAGIENLDGVGTVAIDAKAHGRTWGEVAETLAGKASVAIADGVLDGIDVAGLPDAIKDPEGGALAGSTTFTSANATLAFADGTVATEDLQAAGDAFTLRMTGKAGLFDPTLEARGTLTLLDSEDGAGPTDVPFLISGTRSDWRVLPDLGPPVERAVPPPEPEPEPASPANPSDG